MGKIHTSGEAIEPWKGQVATFRVENNSFNELLGMDGVPIEFEWKNFPRFTALQIRHKIQSDMQGAHIEPEEFSNNKGNEASCTLTSTKIREYALRFLKGHWAFWDLEKKTNGFVGMTTNQKEEGIPLLLEL